MLETGSPASSTEYAPSGKALAIAEKLLDHFKVARLRAQDDDERLKRLDFILPYVTSKLRLESDEVAEPDDPELAYISNFVIKQVQEPWLGAGYIELEDPIMVERIWLLVQTFRYYSVPT
jgi:hypothetical protein